MSDSQKRRPQLFDPDDPGLSMPPDPPPAELRSSAQRGGDDEPNRSADLRIGLDDARRGFSWGAMLLATMGMLASIALALSFARFVSVAFERNDWIGWTSFALLLLAALSAGMLILREAVGFVRLRRLGRLRADADTALATRDLALEKDVAERITAPLARRADCAWALARLREREGDAHDAGDRLRLIDRHLLASLDVEARRTVAAAARRIGTVSAISPSALITVAWVLIDNMRLLRRLAGLYGGRPGTFATAKLAKLVVGHIVATGGVAMTDDLLGQFLGQDLVRRLSRRLGESVFNAALTARVGAAAIEVIRPLPYLEAAPVRARDFISEIVRLQRGGGASPKGDGQKARAD